MKEFPYDPGIDPRAKVFHKATPLPPEKRLWVEAELKKLEKAGVVRRVATCKCASNLVLVDKG